MTRPRAASRRSERLPSRPSSQPAASLPRSVRRPPETNVEIVVGPEFPSTGVGEVSLGPTGGAIANAIANAFTFGTSHLREND
jgi:hypothetical protein